MSDHTIEDTETEAEETTGAQGATEDTHPWGDDFDPARAWSTIQQQREAENNLKNENRTLKEQAEFASRLREDPQALREFLEEQGYEFELDDDDEDDDA